MYATPTDMGRSAGAVGSAAQAGRDFVPDEGFFARAGRPFGRLSVGLAIGPLRFRLEGLSPRQAEDLETRFSPFVGEPGASPDLTIDLRAAEVAAFLALPTDGSEIYRMGRRRTGARLSLWSYEFAGLLDLEASRAVLALVAPEGALYERGLENFLRAMTAAFILDRKGFLLHGSCVVRGGRAYVFFGPSGSGKTTVARLSAKDTVLSDDLTLVVPGEAGHQAAGIPFGMAHHRAPQTNRAFPIASFNRLAQSREVRRERIEGARAVAEMAGSLPFVMEEPAQAAAAIDTVAAALEGIPVYRLFLRKDDSFWSVVEEVS